MATSRFGTSAAATGFLSRRIAHDHLEKATCKVALKDRF